RRLPRVRARRPLDAARDRAGVDRAALPGAPAGADRGGRRTGGGTLMSGGLYDIAEPGESTPKAAWAGRAGGIHPGPPNPLVAVVRDRTPVCLPDGEGRVLLPSAVRYRADAAPVVGYDALFAAAQHPRDTIVSVKRFMGRGPEDAETTRRFTPYQFAS